MSHSKRSPKVSVIATLAEPKDMPTKWGSLKLNEVEGERVSRDVLLRVE